MSHTVDAVVLAYLDPGSGSLLFQAAVGAVMATTLAVKVYWRRIKALFSHSDRDRVPGSSGDE